MKLYGILKPTVCLDPTLDDMFGMAHRLTFETPPKNIVILDPYMELLDKGITGLVLLLKDRNKEKMQLDFMSKLKSCYNEITCHIKEFGKDTKIIICPLIPVNMVMYNLTQSCSSESEEEQAQQALLESTIMDLNDCIVEFNTKNGVETPRLDQDIKWLEDNWGVQCTDMDGNGIGLENVLWPSFVNRFLKTFSKF